eukprot:5526729-Pyramimonas_sp.AAC.1
MAAAVVHSLAGRPWGECAGPPLRPQGGALLAWAKERVQHGRALLVQVPVVEHRGQRPLRALAHEGVKVLG